MDETLSLIARLADAHGRQEAVTALAAHLGIEALLLFVRDPDVDALVPAPGFPQSLPGGKGWRDLLKLCLSPGVHRGVVDYPATGALVSAFAHADRFATTVLVGGPPIAGRLDVFSKLLPLVMSTLRAEQARLVAAGELEVARDGALRSEALTHALDRTRGEVEDALSRLEKQAASLDEARARAEEGTRAKDEFLAMLGHELRNPLAPIVTAVDLLRASGKPSRELDVIERQIRHLVHLVDDLLDVSRITEGKIDLHPVRIDLVEVAARAIEMASPLLERKRQSLAVEIPESGLFLDVDPTRMAQVLSNLLTNAAKYSDEGTRIVLRGGSSGGLVQIRVLDEGYGIDPEMLDRIFDLFVQHRQSAERSRGGLGLGLAIVRSLVRLHGGTVVARSAGLGMGSEFIVELPAAQGDVAPGGATPPGAAALTPRSASGRRVLVVDDNEDAALMLTRLLSRLGHDVLSAPDGPTALRIAADFRPEIALLDIGLPVMDGFELGWRLRLAAGATTLHLLAISGYGQDADKRRSGEAGFDAHLVKPIDLHELAQRIAALPRV